MRSHVLCLTVVAAAILGGLLAPVPATAQRTPPGTPGTGTQGRPAPTVLQNATGQRRAPTEQEVRAAAGAQILEFQLIPSIALGALQAVNAAQMEGWTPVTNGATLGGASIVKLPSGHRLVVRGADSGLHDAPIDVVNQSTPLPGSAWRSLGRTATSEPYCAPEHSSADDNYFCGYLRSGGAAEVARVSSWGVGSYWPMGGTNGGGRVTIGGSPFSGYALNSIETGFNMLVWDGGTRLFSRVYQARQALVPGAQGAAMEVSPPELQGWKALGGVYLTPIGCRREVASMSLCAQGTTNGVRLFSDPWSRTALEGAIPPTFAVPSPLPTPIGRTAPEITTTASGAIIVVVRAANGTVHHTRRPASGGAFGPWISEGGAAREGSGISCTTVNEQPICFIQATDGRIYRKAFATASGL